MASKRTIELKNLSVEDLKNEVIQLSSELSKLKFDHAVSGIANPLQIPGLRKEIARLHTEVRARELADMSPELLAKRNRIIERRK